jgi:hypothetical protein
MAMMISNEAIGDIDIVVRRAAAIETHRAADLRSTGFKPRRL